MQKLEQLLGHCEALEQRMRESRRLAEQLLQTALREALAAPEGVGAGPVAAPVGAAPVYATGNLFARVSSAALLNQRAPSAT